MGGFFSSPSPPPAPAVDTSYLDETRKQREKEDAKNKAKLNAIRARSGSGGPYALLEFTGPGGQLSDKLGS